MLAGGGEQHAADIEFLIEAQLGEEADQIDMAGLFSVTVRT
jgi:hypothetical protein